MKLPDYSNTSNLTKIRHWLIRLIAGKHVVLLNARLRLVAVDPGIAVEIIEVNGVLVQNCSFPERKGLILQIGQKEK